MKKAPVSLVALFLVILTVSTFPLEVGIPRALPQEGGRRQEGQTKRKPKQNKGGQQRPRRQPQKTRKQKEPLAPGLEASLLKRLKFRPGVTLGNPVQSDCITRCHIDYPFAEVTPFSHAVHSPENGFECNLCHNEDPLPLRTHGRMDLPEGDCTRCHHDTARFPDCKMCHQPVFGKTEVRGMAFDHAKHSASLAIASCAICHTDMDKPAKERVPPDCRVCHHVKNSPVTCQRCHESALSSGLSDRFDGFDHGRHASSEHLRGGCQACHTPKLDFNSPDKMDCVSCHHPSDPASAPKCTVCHDPVDVQVETSREGLPFFHGKHVQAGFECLECHDRTTAHTSPIAKNNCVRCHHQEKEGCRRCHTRKLYFAKSFGNIPGGDTVTFIHASHESDDNCGVCHIPDPEMGEAMQGLSCAACHHHSGNEPACGTCHGHVEALRAGRLPSGGQGSPEVMYGIVTCGMCHLFDPSVVSGITDGSRSCTTCHPTEYHRLYLDRRSALERVLMKRGTEMELMTPERILGLGIHNFPLFMDHLQKRAVTKVKR